MSLTKPIEKVATELAVVEAPEAELPAGSLTSSETLREAVRKFGPDIDEDLLDELEDDLLVELIL